MSRAAAHGGKVGGHDCMICNDWIGLKVEILLSPFGALL